MEFNIGDFVHVQSYGKGIIIKKEQDYKETVTTIYLVKLIDRDKTLWFCSDSLVFASKGEVEEIMAGIRNKYVNTKVVAPNKETGTFEPYAINKSDDLYQKALEAAKKMSNAMYGVGHSVSATVLRNDFNHFLNEVKDIKFSGPATIVFWKDGTKTIVKCQEGEHYDPKEGIKYALLKKIAGGTSNQASKMAKKYDEWLEKWIPEDMKVETFQEEPTSDYEFMKEASDYLAEEMKKRLVGLGELADTVKAATDKVRAATEEVRKAKDLYLREHGNDKSEETEEK